MKKYLVPILAVVALGAGLAACKKEKPDVVSKVVTVSYPDITINGSKFVTLPVGGTFVDSGASFTDAFTGENGSITADVSDVPLDVNTPGLYTLTYTAKNQNTYSSVAARYVAVTDYADNGSIGGAYRRTQNNAAVTVTKMSRALYSISDIGAANLGNVGYFAILDTTTIDFGYQYSETLGAFIEADVHFLHLRPADTSFEYVIYAPGYGTATRTFKKQ